jgi:hypothetical protein
MAERRASHERWERPEGGTWSGGSLPEQAAGGVRMLAVAKASPRPQGRARRMREGPRRSQVARARLLLTPDRRRALPGEVPGGVDASAEQARYSHVATSGLCALVEISPVLMRGQRTWWATRCRLRLACGSRQRAALWRVWMG